MSTALDLPAPARRDPLALAAAVLAQIDAERAALAAEIEAAADRMVALAAPPRPSGEVGAPGDGGGAGRQQQLRNALRQREELQAAIDTLRARDRDLAAQRARLQRELDALRRLAAWDELCAATAAANAITAELAPDRDHGARDLAELRHRRDAALRRRAVAFVAWRCDFAGDAIPALSGDVA